MAMLDGGMDTAVADDGGLVDARTDVPIDAAVEPGRLAIGDFAYEGAFRFSAAEFGESSVNYAVGTLGYNPDRHSLFIAGHAQHAMLAEFAIPDTLGTGDDVAALPVVEEPLQGFRPLLERAQTGNPDAIDRVTGMLWRDGDLLVNGNNWYDAAGSASDTTLVIPGGDLDGTVEGYYKLEGAARVAGFMAHLPSPWAERLGAPALAGWASNYSIVSRYSVGPTLFAFDPVSLTLAQLGRFTFDDGGAASVTDIAIDRDGLLYALSAGTLYVCDPVSVECTPQGPSSANSAGFAEFGALDPDDDVLVLVEGSEVVHVRVGEDGTDITVVGTLEGYSSSGDVMPLGGTTMLLSSPNAGGDLLVAFDAATAESLGPLTNLPSLSYGLAGFGGDVWVFTDLGEVLRVDEDWSVQSMVRVDVRLWGAATHPESR